MEGSIHIDLRGTFAGDLNNWAVVAMEASDGWQPLVCRHELHRAC
jgi:hypothetical protein